MSFQTRMIFFFVCACNINGYIFNDILVALHAITMNGGRSFQDTKRMKKHKSMCAIFHIFWYKIALLYVTNRLELTWELMNQIISLNYSDLFCELDHPNWITEKIWLKIMICLQKNLFFFTIECSKEIYRLKFQSIPKLLHKDLEIQCMSHTNHFLWPFYLFFWSF